MLEVGIIGGSGFVAGELIRILVHHPKVNIDFIYSRTHAGKKAYAIHQDLVDQPKLKFTNKVNLKTDIVFLSLGHGNSSKFLKGHKFSQNTKIIDLSSNFRLKENAVYQKRKYTYGLVELNKTEIQHANHIANPGCFATAIQLAILPLIKYASVLKDFHIHAITGSTGAGQTLNPTTAHSWRSGNISVYKAFNHQHLLEIKESISKFHDPSNFELNFIPLRGDFTRGIFASIYTETNYCENELKALYVEFYKDAKFTHLVENNLNLKQVLNTNNCLIQVQKIGSKVYINSAIDNLLKGAAGQAIQNMNLMFGLDESLGLNLKASYF